MKRIFYLLTILSTLALSALGQEICNNGVDDDGNGFIDCFDNQCSSNAACDGSYIGNDALCEAVPAQFPEFRMTLDWASPNKTTNHLNRMSVGDLDRDGIPEVIVTNIEGSSRGAYVLFGNSGQIKYSKTNFPFTIDREVVIGNIDDDNCAEIFFTGTQSGTWYIWSYNCDLTVQNWQSAALGGDPGMFGLADFNGDGQVELYFRDVILNAHTGVEIANSSSSYGSNNGSPVAVDIVGDEDLELVNGLRIFSVDIDAGTITEHSKRNEYFLRSNPDGSHTSIADFNQDGDLDIIASGSTSSNNTNTTIFFWDVAHNTLKTYSDPRPGNFTIQNCQGGTGYSTGEYYKTGWHRGTGRINIADANGDGNLDLAYVSGKFLYAVTESATGADGLDTLWVKEVSEETSGYTGCSMFDFNGDGKTEIVYRDERNLYIINGTDGSTYTSQPCISRTARDYPIVADIDADGQSELCVTCGFDNQLAADNFCDLSYSENSHVRVYRTDLEPWVPSRRVWNQNAYFNVNVNDDLTIPRRQQGQMSEFSQNGCSLGGPMVVRPLNTFLNQSPYLNSQGCPTYASPNLSYVDNSLTVAAPTCPETDFTISFTIENLGDVPVSGDVPITFYKGDPLQPGAIKLNTIFATLVSLSPSTQFTITNATVNGDGSDFTLYIAINDTGNSGPSPITFPNSTILECDYDNIVSVDVNPIPAAITAELIKDNIKCLSSTTPDNGAVEAFVPEGTTENTTDYDFYWSNGTAVNNPADFTGAVYTGLADAAYTVYAVHKTAQCSSDTTSITVGRVEVAIEVAISLVQNNTNCVNPNGALEATVPGQPLTNYSFAWYEGNDIFTNPQVGVNNTITGLSAFNYTVLVIDNFSGCPATESQAISDVFQAPDPDITTTDILCSAATSGQVSATVGGTTTGYTFEWFDGNNEKPTADFTGSDYTNLPAGNYTLVVTDNVSECPSVPETVTVTQTVAPVVTAFATSQQTSCDNNQLNGAATAAVAGVTAGYSFEWFSGQNTLPPTIATTPTISGLDVGVYTVRATDLATGCSDTEEVTISFGVVTHSLAVAAVADMTNCINADGSVTVNVLPDAPSEYTFNWYIGSTVGTDPDFAETGPTLSGLPIGTYTVQAVHNTKHCTTAPVTAEVIDDTPAIEIQQESSVLSFPTDCNEEDGILGVEVTAENGNTNGFDMEWFKEPEGTLILSETVAQFSTASGLSSGNYTVKATNRDNGCSAEKTFALPFKDAHQLNFISKSDASTCSPQNEGSVAVQLIPTPLVLIPPITVADYDLFLYQGQDSSTPPIQQVNGASGTVVGNVANHTFSNLSPGFYTVTAVEIGLNGCESVPVVVEILPYGTNPVIEASSTSNNTNCAGVVLPTGQITAEADNANPAGYSFDWFDGPDTSSPSLTTTSGVNDHEAINLDAGQYTVLVTNNTTQCTSTATFSIFNNPPIITMANTDLTLADLSNCTITNGSAELTGISENGLAASLTNYTIEWFSSAMASLGTTNPVTGLSPGTYFVRATSNTTNCANELKEFEIEDRTIGTVFVDLTSFTEPTQCLKPANIIGELVVDTTGLSMGGYTVNWYAGTTVGTPADIISNATTFSGLASGDYTVEVINNDNDCVVTDTYTLPLNQVEVTMTASAASPMTHCDVNNGEVFALVTSGSPVQYNYTWVNSTGTVVGTVGHIQNLGVDSYTVTAVDQNDPACTAGPLEVTIEDGRIDPVPAAIEAAPITACDPALADGVATASVSGNITDYIFTWYAGNVVDPANLVYTGVQASGLLDITYTVQATHAITGCTGEATVTITRNVLSIPNPVIDIISHVTNCDPTIETGNNVPVNNGSLSASVNGNTSNYIFNWDTGYAGEIYGDLAAGTYIVTATDRTTGCVSGPVNATILENLIVPEFDFRTMPATCDQPNGYVAIEITNNITVSEIRWDVDLDESTVFYSATGPILGNAYEGVYPVLVRSSQGCFSLGEVTVGTEIRAFNGISRGNGNLGQNDKFRIACIESFENAVVKIFNRAGTLVYEATRYNNEDVVFNGQSNKGISPLGTDLPDGTYFYIIDKNDGSKPIAGYLEIVN